MSRVPETTEGPYPFTQQDMEPAALLHGAEHTLRDFYDWRDAHPEMIAEHVDLYTEQLADITAGYRPTVRIMRALSPTQRRTFGKQNMQRQVEYFGFYNLGEEPDLATAEQFRSEVYETADIVGQAIKKDGYGNISSILEALEYRIPALHGVPEVGWLDEQLTRLHHLLPETVIRNGGMGKVIRTMLGVMAIGAFDVLAEPEPIQQDHMRRILPGAYGYGASYALVDDTLQDLPGSYISVKDKQRYHETILHGLTMGQGIDLDTLPDHPLAEEMHRIYTSMLEHYPFERYRHLYHAAESMYCAQHRDAERTEADVAAAGLTSLYPDLFIKAGMSRVVANILGRREVPPAFYEHTIHTTFSGQLKDDLADRTQDAREGRVTPFTFMRPTDTDPLYDLFAYDAYVARVVFGDTPSAAVSFARFGAAEMGAALAQDSAQAKALLAAYPATQEIARFVLAAAHVPLYVARRLDPSDIRLKKGIGDILQHREQTDIDPRTFVSDRLDYIDATIQRLATRTEAGGLHDVVRYALEAGGKRLRPALTLMLAESLQVPYPSVEPLLAAIEMFHTASLIFDDLPAQDNAALRRGQPTVHVQFGEDRAQLTGIAMISSAFGLLATLGEHFPNDRVNDVVTYVGSVLGPERLCLGQDMDLRMERADSNSTGEEIIQMYSLKTSTMIEAALVPLMMLTGRPVGEIQHIKEYAHHAGIVFQIRDDLLDTTATSENLGKDTGSDGSKVNVVRAYGADEAQRCMQQHLEAAIAACQAMPYNTYLLQGIVTHFAERTH